MGSILMKRNTKFQFEASETKDIVFFPSKFLDPLEFYLPLSLMVVR